MADADPVMKPGDWRKRRRVIYLSLAFCAGAVAFVLAFPGDAVAAPVRGQIAMALVALAASVIGAYCGFATWDDHNARKDGA